MRRTHGANNVGSLPTRATSGTAGYFVDRDVVGGVAGTVIEQDFLNILQEEIIAVLADWSVTPDDTGVDVSQLRDAIRLAVAGIVSDAVSYAGSNTQTRVMIGSTAGFVGGNDLTLLGATDRASCAGAGCAILASVCTNPNFVLIETGVTYSAILACFGSTSIEDIVTTSAILASSSSAITTSGATDLIAASNDAYIDASTRCAILATEGTTGISGGSDCGAIIASGASGASTLDDAHSAAHIATNGCLIDGGANASLVAASGGSTITNATHDAILASYNSSITASPSGSSKSAMIGTDSCLIPTGSPLFGVVMLGSQFCDASLGSMSAADKAYSVMGGYDGSTPSARTWGIESQTGTFRGTAAYATGGLDYAEFFVNHEGKAHPPGRLLARQGRAARLAQPGDRILGIVSADPTVVGGDDGIAWSGRYLRDEWGRPVKEQIEVVQWPGYDGPTETAPPAPGHATTYMRCVEIDEVEEFVCEDGTLVTPNKIIEVPYIQWEPYTGTTSAGAPPDGAETVTLNVRKTNPAWVPSQTQVPRSQRPDEWTVVGLVGQLRIAVDNTVNEGDDVVAGKDGIGTRGDGSLMRGAQVECMEIVAPYSKKKGYGIAQVFIR